MLLFEVVSLSCFLFLCNVICRQTGFGTWISFVGSPGDFVLFYFVFHFFCFVREWPWAIECGRIHREEERNKGTTKKEMSFRIIGFMLLIPLRNSVVQCFVKTLEVTLKRPFSCQKGRSTLGLKASSLWNRVQVCSVPRGSTVHLSGRFPHSLARWPTRGGKKFIRNCRVAWGKRSGVVQENSESRWW